VLRSKQKKTPRAFDAVQQTLLSWGRFALSRFHSSSLSSANALIETIRFRWPASAAAAVNGAPEQFFLLNTGRQACRPKRCCSSVLIE
jgi:hypothetical protein